MITGSFYVGSDISVTLDTGIVLTDALSVSVEAKFQDGSTETYTGEVVDFTKVKVTVPAEDNTQPGSILFQAHAELDDPGTAIGETEQVVVLDAFAPPP